MWGVALIITIIIIIIYHTHIYYADAAGMLARPAGHEAKAEARKSEAEAEAQNFFSMPRPRPDTLENNSRLRYWRSEHSFQ